MNTCVVVAKSFRDDSLPQLLKHRHHVYNAHSPAWQVCCQPFLSTGLSLRTKFSKFVLVLLFCCYSVAFHKVRIELLAQTSLGYVVSFRVMLRVFFASRSCPSYWLCSSTDQIYQQYYYKYIIYIYIYISRASNWYLVLVARAEVFKYKYHTDTVLTNFRNALPL